MDGQLPGDRDRLVPPRRRVRIVRSLPAVLPIWIRLAMPAGLLVVVVVIMLASTRGLLSRPGAAGSEQEPAGSFLQHLDVPDYPATALARGEEGRVVTLVRVDAAGSVSEAAVVRSSGWPALDSAAAVAAAASRFGAYHRGGRRVGTRAAVAYAFDLSSGRAFPVPVRPDEGRLVVERDTVRTVDAAAVGVELAAEVPAESLRGARIRVMVEADGGVSRTILLRSTGTPGQDSVVRSLAGRLQFDRPKLGGKPVRCWLELGRP